MSNEEIVDIFQGQNSVKISQLTLKIDFTKVKTIEDIVEIMDALDLTFNLQSWSLTDKHKKLIDKGLLTTKP